ncbi:hypothetical protein AcW1_003569 [Taiwanofungus camphoratus]|nr:hypothetical protein AcV5_001969 [Antrodia cinnamomea]KAI0941770.1 hypothetical protein AcW1_003569 [Antrodia cinnamomea]KAI0960732.1 hypothetical protein AcV7_000033 [Antrodia cinnamomea]
MICGHLWRSLISDAQVLYAANKRLVISSPLLNCFHTYFKELTAMGKLDSIHGPHPESTHTMPHPASPGIVTYRLRERMVYVTPAETYDQAIAYAKTVFADELYGVDPERISFSVSVVVQGGTRTVSIGSMAWKAVIASLAQYEIIDVLVQDVTPEVVVHDVDELPEYSETKEPKEFFSRSPSPSHSKSRTPSRSPSRSPSRKSHSPTHSPRHKAINWLEKHF